MPEKRIIARARRDAAQGRAPTTQAGEFVREEMRHIREGEHGARSTKQAIAIGLSKARRSGVKLAAPKGPRPVRRKAQRDLAKARSRRRPSARRVRAAKRALRRERRRAATRRSVARRTARGRKARGR
jgi:hypothetical protein